MSPSFHGQMRSSWWKNWHQQQVGVTETIGCTYESIGMHLWVLSSLTLSMPPCTCCVACARVNWATCVHDVYCIQTVFNIYKMEFVPVVNEDYWPEYHRLPIWPNPELKQATEGRPVST